MAGAVKDALVVNEMLPLTVPLAKGSKTTLRLMLCPGLNASGGVSPTNWNPLPFTVAWEMVTFEPPALLNVTDLDWVFPSVTAPKPTLAGAASCPGARPMPVSETAELFDALLANERAAVALPAALGVNVTFQVAPWPIATVAGSCGPLME